MSSVSRLHGAARLRRTRTHQTTRLGNVCAPVAFARRPFIAAIVIATALATIVASAPRLVNAQAAPAAHHTVRHTLRGDVGAVTQVALSLPWRPAVHELGVPSNASPLSQRSWMQRADVRSNVRTMVVLEPSAQSPVEDSRDGWQVVNADGQLVPWRQAPIVLSQALPAGQHDVMIVWVAPPGATGAPAPVVRLQIVSGAR